MIFLALIGILLGLLVIRHFTWRSHPWPEGAVRPPSYQGHRGYWKEGAQENTLTSFVAAKRRGLEMVEMDVRLSRDQIPVVFHDADLKRLAGSAKEVHECTAAELFQWAQAPTLEAVLLSSQVPAKLNIELKTSSLVDGNLERKVTELIKHHKAEGRILFSSFNPLSLWRLSRYLPEVPRALLASQEKEPGNHIYLRRLWLAPYVRIHALHLDYHDVSVQDLQRWKKRKIPVALWTVNEKEIAEAYLQAGAFSIITDTLVD
ncbi:glycerophosphodiester phosphodiesterase [Bdellovibrio sp.]|uniref:glycerophosphodiester phosphodiesterase n=1 Tax=Bdellovibrio sp. TaxID=28201 RepID=UPI0039E34717